MFRPPAIKGCSQHLGVTVGDEGFALGFQIGADLPPVPDFAVERQHGIAAPERLVRGGGQVHQGQANMPVDRRAGGIDARGVGAAMADAG